MTDEAEPVDTGGAIILKQAIEKAIEQDWTMFLRVPFKHTTGIEWDVLLVPKRGGFTASYKPILKIASGVDVKEFYELEQILFDIDFAKAFWGDELVYDTGEEIPEGYNALLHPTMPRWKYHMQQIATAHNRLAYLAENS